MSDTTTNLSRQMQSDYLAYSMAVIIGRAIPSLTDGLKPAQRRVLTAMKWLGLSPTGRYMKSARVEGETMGKLHPHGGAYGVMVTMAAPWTNNLPFIDGHGNWGSSVDGAAAARYTECKTSPFTWDCLLADSDTWQLIDNYDGSLKEPIELNVKVPAVLLNGQEGIGVGFATKIPPHSLRDVCDAVCKGTELVPSFPTGCDIVNDDGLAEYQKTGIGSMTLRAKHTTGKVGTGKRARDQITFTNLPPNTNPEKVGEQIKNGLDKGSILGVTEVRDDSDLTGDRITLTLKSGTDLELATRQLYYYTDLDTRYSARLLVVDGTKPVELSPSELVSRWKAWRMDRLGVIFSHERDTKEHRLNIVQGLLKAISKIDLVIKLIRAAATPKDALIALVGERTLKLNKVQAQAILDMRLRALTNLDSEELTNEQNELEESIAELAELIGNEKKRENFLKKEVRAIGTRYGEKRRSEIIAPPVSLTVEKGTSRSAAPARPRFMKIDKKRGTVEQAKGPRGAMVVEGKEKVILATESGYLRKVPANFKGPIATEYSPVVLASRETEVTSKKYLVVFELDGALKAMVLSGSDLCKANSKGKTFLTEGAKLIHFGENAYTVTWKSKRKKPVVLDLSTKAGKPNGKGIKVGNMSDLG